MTKIAHNSCNKSNDIVVLSVNLYKATLEGYNLYLGLYGYIC